MTDEMIVDMYWKRSERAIEETAKKYGGYCRSIAYNILRNNEDTDECVNDTYLKAWNSMPSQRPYKLAAFLGKITRNLALRKYEYYSAKKRGGIQTELVLDELLECVSNTENAGDIVDDIIIREILNAFLDSLNADARKIFVCRYWFLYSAKEIAEKYRLSENKVNVSLHRSRSTLKMILEKEGLY